jgi:hypothetical protein
MTIWRRSLPAARRRPALPQSSPPSPPAEQGQPWVPDEPAELDPTRDGPGGQSTSGARLPAGTALARHRPGEAPPATGLTPFIVSDWELTEEADGTLRARPRLLSVPRAAVTVKDDDAPSRERVRRFVEAWRWLIAARSQIQETGLSADESDRYLAGAGVLIRIVPPSAHRRPRPIRSLPSSD